MPQQSARELLEQLRKEQEQPPETAAQMLARLRQEQTEDIDESPFEIPSTRTVPFSFSGGLNPRQSMRPVPRVSGKYAEAADSGVDVITGSPVGRFESGFAENEAMAAANIAPQLSEHYGVEVNMRRGPISQELEFLNPETRRWTLVNEATATTRDIFGSAGTALPIAGAVAGEYLAGPWGAGIGGAIGEGGRRLIGEALGVRDESASDIARGAAGVGVIEGGAAGAGNLAVRGYQMGRNFLFPRPLSPEDAARLLVQSEANQLLADEISRRTGNQLQPFTGQLADDPLLLSQQAELRNSNLAGLGIREQQKQNETALEGFFDLITPQGGPDPSVAGGAIQREARRYTDPMTQEAQQALEGQIARLEQLTSDLPQISDVATAQQVRSEIHELRTAVNAVEDMKWNAVRDAYNYNPDTALSDVKITVDGELEQLIRRLRTEAKEALDPAMASGKEQLAGQRLLPDADEISDADAQMLLFASEDIHTLDLHQVQELLSFLRKRERIARTGEVATDPQGRDIIRLRSALERQRNSYLQDENPELLNMIQDAEATTRSRANIFDNGLIGDLLRIGRDGRYILSNTDVVARTIASRDVESIRHLVSVLEGHPAGLPTLQQGFLAYYEREVVVNGIPDAALHRQFIRRNDDVIDELFGDQANRVKRLGNIAQAVDNNAARVQRFQQQIARRFEGRIQDIAPERVVETVFNASFSTKDIRQIMALADAAGYADMYRQALGDILRRRFVSPTSGINIRSLSRFFGDESEKLGAIYGPGYVADMNKLLEMLSVARRTETTIRTSQAPTLVETLARPTVARPLSRAGVALTRSLKFRERAIQRFWESVITDRQTLHAVILRSNMDAQSRQVAELLGIMGASAIIYGDESP